MGLNPGLDQIDVIFTKRTETGWEGTQVEASSVHPPPLS